MTPDDIEKWFQAHFSGGAVAQQTAAFNQVFAAKEALKEALAAEAKAETPAPAKD